MKVTLRCAVFALVCAYAQAQCCMGFGFTVDGSKPWSPIPTTASTCAAIVGVTSIGGLGAGAFVTDCPKYASATGYVQPCFTMLKYSVWKLCVTY